MDFHCILGQDRLKKNIKNTLKNHRILHAYVIEGQKGLGKKRIAYMLAKGICCRGEEERPCNQCVSCKKLEHGNHPEIKWLEDETSIKIDAIRQLQKDLQIKPYEGTKKVYIICDADRMTLQAQNALLKTLEEPPEYATILLLTTKASSLLPTILSRCQRMKLIPVKSQEIQQYLVEKKAVSIEEAKVVASFSNGIIGRGLQLLEDEAFKNRRKEIIRITRDVVDKTSMQLLENVDFFNEGKPYIDEILEIFMGWYRDLLVYKETKKSDYVINIDEMEEISYQSGKLSLNSMKEMIFIIDKARDNLRSNGNYQLNIEVMLLELKEKTKY